MPSLNAVSFEIINQVLKRSTADQFAGFKKGASSGSDGVGTVHGGNENLEFVRVVKHIQLEMDDGCRI